MLALVAAACGGRMEYAVDRTLLSPDGTVRAVLYHGQGGAPAEYCTRGLKVLPASAPVPAGDSLRLEPGHDPFGVSCSSRISLRWRTADTLEVAYTVDAAGVEVWQRASTEDGRTHLAFVVLAR